MGFFDFLALRTDCQIRGLEVFVGASFIPPGFGMSVFWICHVCVMLLKLFLKRPFASLGVTFLQRETVIFSVNLLTLKMHRSLPVHFADDRTLFCSGPLRRHCKDLCSPGRGGGPWEERLIFVLL